jgi:translocation and assembly module TamB
MKRPRRLRVAALTVAALLVVLFLAARWYLSSRQLADQVTARLQDALGAPVRLDTVDVGFVGGSSLRGLHVYEADAAPDDKPFLNVDNATADVSALGFLAGNATPSQVTLTGASIDLHFDADGRLVTRLPRPKGGAGTAFPRLHVSGGTLTIAQDGRKPMVVQGVTADVSGQGDLTVNGSIADPLWGDWTLDGSMHTAGGAVALHLNTPRVEVNRDRLTALPFVGPSVWEEVMVTGPSPVDFRLEFTAGEKDAKITYRVECQPRDAHVRVRSIDLDADGAAGQVVVQDNVVSLQDVAARFADGSISLPSANLDFSKAAWALEFHQVAVDKVVLHSLPKSWVESIRGRFDVDGDLTGQAEVSVGIDGDRVHINGTGAGLITNVTLLGQPQRKPIELELEKSGNRLRLKPKDSASLAPVPLPDAGAVVVARPAARDEPPAPPSPLDPVALAGWLPRGVTWGTGRATKAVGDGLATAAGWFRNRGPDEPETYLDLKLSLEDVDLGQLLSRLDLKLPFAVEGRLSFDVQAGFPVNSPRNVKKYRMTGSAISPRLNVAGVEFTDLKTRVKYDDGVLTLEEVSGQAPPPRGGAAGTFAGDTRVQIEPLGDLTAHLKVDHVPLATALDRLPGGAVKGEGAVSGRVEARAPVKTLTDLTTWTGSGRFTSDRLSAYGLTLTEVSTDVTVGGGKLQVSGLKAALEKAPVTGSAELRLADPYPYTGTLTLARADLAAAQRLAPDSRPPFAVAGAADVTAELKGALSPFSVSASGTARADGLTLDQVKVDAASLAWDADADRVRLTAVKAKLYQGEITGTATVPVRAGAAGGVDLTLDGVNVQALAKVARAMPVKLEGKASGTVRADIPAADADKPREAKAKVELTAPKLKIQNIPAEKLHADVAYRGGSADYLIVGETLGGRFRLEGKYPSKEGAPERGRLAPRDGASGPPEEPDGRFKIEGARLARLWPALGLGGALGQLRGVVDLDLSFRVPATDFAPTGTGRIAVRDLRYGDVLLTESLHGDIRLRGDTVQLRELSAAVGEGSFRGQISYNYRKPDRSRFTITLDRVESGLLLVPWPDLAAAVQGPADVRLHGSLGGEWRVHGAAELTRGRVFGVGVGEWRLPLNITYRPAFGGGQLDVRDSTARLGHGRATGQASLLFGPGTRLEGNVRFYGAELRSLVRGDLGSYGAGDVTGRVDFGADELRSADDLYATVDASLSQTQALEIPVLRLLAPYIAPGQSSTTFNQGELRGRLAHGVFRVQHWNMSSRLIQVVIEGTVTLTGRLDLEATARLGRLGLNPAFLRLVGVSIPTTGAIPVAVILQVSSALSNRVVHLRVTGTTRNPNVQLEPVQVLTEEAVRFFLTGPANVPLP